MYKLVEAEDIVRVDPSLFGEELEKILLRELRERYEGTVSRELGGIVVLVQRVVEVGEGEIYLGDGAPYYRVKFEALIFSAENKELFKGIVEDVVRFGAFVNIGSFNALLHISQIFNDPAVVDEKNKCIINEKTGERLTVGDLVLVRVIGVSWAQKTADVRIAVTMKQPGLGKIGEKK
ncbi:MAG: DNA-directed RNA polymerase [bacterium]|nr:DNA-directed RNA polymerase [bacterium]